MSFNFGILHDLLKILKKKHLSSVQKLSLFRCLVILKLLIKKKAQHDSLLPITILKYKVFTDNIGDLYATFYEIFIKEEYSLAAIGKYDTVIDAGANVGLATIYFKWLYPAVKIIGFEMDEDTFFFYQKNIQTNKMSGVTVYQYAVGKTEGKFSTYGSRRATTLYKERGEILPDRADPDRIKTVQVKKLSEYIPSTGVTCLKMDIEGAEIEVLHELASANMLSRLQFLIFEFHFQDDKKYLEISELLITNGFSVYKSGLQKNGYYMISAKNTIIK